MTGPAMINIAQRVFETPLMLDPAKASVIAQAYGPRVLGAVDETPVQMNGYDGAATAAHTQPRAASMIGDELHRALCQHGGGYSTVMGIAVIPVCGTLVRRGSFVGESSGQTSYEGISAQIRAAVADPDVRAIALEIDSFGGEAAGVFELASQIRAAREVKQVHAFIADYALSAGYAIASQADHITVPSFGEAGSIGVVSMHASYEGHLSKQGVEITLIHSGASKVDGNPFESLPPHVLESLQSGCDEMWVRLAEDVALGRRNKLSVEAALKTEARVFRGSAAMAAGLVDAVAEARTAFEALVDDLNPAPAPLTASAISGAACGIAPAADRVSGSVPLRIQGNQALSKVAPPPFSNCSSDCETGAVSPQHKETDMSKDVIAPEPMASNAATEAAQPAAPVAPTDDDRQAMQAERDRAAKITAKVDAAGLPPSLATELIASGVPLADAYEAIIDKKAESGADGGTIRSVARVTADGRDRAREGMSRALYAKARLDGGERNEFTSMSLREMARASLVAQGVSIPVGGVQALASAADTASVVALSCLNGRFRNCTTVDLTAHFLRPLPVGDVELDVHALSNGRRMATTRVEFRAVGSAKLAATVTCAFAYLED